MIEVVKIGSDASFFDRTQLGVSLLFKSVFDRQFGRRGVQTVDTFALFLEKSLVLSDSGRRWPIREVCLPGVHAGLNASVHDGGGLVVSEFAFELLPLGSVVSFQAVVENHVTVATTAVGGIIESGSFFGRSTSDARRADAGVETLGFCSASVESEFVQASVAEDDVAVSAIAIACVGGPLGVISSVKT